MGLLAANTVTRTLSPIVSSMTCPQRTAALGWTAPLTASLAPHISTMRKNIADALNADVEQISVKATTTERLGFEGEMLGISAQAVALLETAGE